MDAKFSVIRAVNRQKDLPLKKLQKIKVWLELITITWNLFRLRKNEELFKSGSKLIWLNNDFSLYQVLWTTDQQFFKNLKKKKEFWKINYGTKGINRGCFNGGKTEGLEKHWRDWKNFVGWFKGKSFAGREIRRPEPRPNSLGLDCPAGSLHALTRDRLWQGKKKKRRTEISEESGEVRGRVEKTDRCRIILIFSRNECSARDSGLWLRERLVSYNTVEKL